MSIRREDIKDMCTRARGLCIRVCVHVCVCALDRVRLRDHIRGCVSKVNSVSGSFYTEILEIDLESLIYTYRTIYLDNRDEYRAASL